MPVSSQEIDRSCICVLGVSILCLSIIFRLDFRTDPTVYVIFYIFIQLTSVCYNCCYSFYVVWFGLYFHFRNFRKTPFFIFLHFYVYFTFMFV